MKIIQNKKIVIVLLALMSVFKMYPNDDPGFGNGDGGDPGAAPIDMYIPIVLFAIVFSTYFYLKFKNQKNTL